MAEFLGISYDENIYNSYYNMIDSRNDNSGYCIICGGQIPETGIGPECDKMIMKLSTVFKNYDEEAKAFVDSLSLKKWIRAVDIVRSEYMRINLNDNGTPKDFKSQFKKDFFMSITHAERVTRKQFDVMQNDIKRYIEFGGKANVDCLGDINSILLSCDSKRLMDMTKEYHDYMINNPKMIKFAKITFSGAWINLLEDVSKFTKYHKHEVLNNL